MKKVFTLLSVLLLSVCTVVAQDEPDASLAACDEHTVEPFEAGEESVDDFINSAFGPVTNVVTSVIFYSIPLGEEILFDKEDTLQERNFYDNPPVVVEPLEGGLPLGQKYRIEPYSEDAFCIAYEYTADNGDKHIYRKTYQFGQTINDREYAFKVVKNENSPFNIDDAKYYQFKLSAVQLPLVVVYLVTGALIFTLLTRFVNIRKFKLAIDVVRGKYSDPDDEGEVSHFQALTAALSGTVGLGNIAGVAVAISVGGPGATFWMIIAGLLGMSTKFMECTLGVKYRTSDERGHVHGGPMHYLSKGLKKRGMGLLGKIFAGFFAIMCIGASFGGGNMFQVNQAYMQLRNATGGENSFMDGLGWLFGIVIAIIVGLIIIGGIKSIGRTTEKIVPFMVVVYVLAAIIILGGHFNEIPNAFGQIFNGAFGPLAIAGGIIGVLIQGFQRAAFSNEAGIGSASIAHSAVKTRHPASEGVVALLEPFIDTVVVCTMTALVIIITNNHYHFEGVDGVTLTSTAFNSVIPHFDIILTVAVILFAISTMLSWSYYGLQSWQFLFGNSQAAEVVFKVVFLGFIIVGAASSLGNVIGFSDAMIFAMSIPNVIGLLILYKEPIQELQRYVKDIKDGVIKTVK